MGTSEGIIIATIITTHMPRNDAAAPGHVCPGIRIHAIDIVQPPGIGISPIADMDAQFTTYAELLPQVDLFHFTFGLTLVPQSLPTAPYPEANWMAWYLAK